MRQADGNGSGDYMHSGMRGSPHVGAFRRCSFTKAEIDSNRVSRASPASRLLVSVQQALMVAQFPSVLQGYLSLQDARHLTSYPHQIHEHESEAIFGQRAGGQ